MSEPRPGDVVPVVNMYRVFGTLAIEGTPDVWTLSEPPSNWQHIGTDGGVLAKFRCARRQQSVLVSAALMDGVVWVHASISGMDLPTYADLVALKAWVFGSDGIACQVFPQKSQHVNIHPHCLHLWGPLDPGDWPLPHFGQEGTI